MKTYPIFLSFVIFLILANFTIAQAKDVLEKSIETTTNNLQASSDSQEKINELSEATRRLAAEYRSLLLQAESVKTYNDQLANLVASQEKQHGSLQQQLQDIKITEREIMPLILRMVTTLEAFISRDIPFLMEERLHRLTALQALINKANVTTAEKFRRVMEAYQVETEFGRTIETYQAKLSSDEKSETVDFLRIGRTALLYISLDGKKMGYWQAHKKHWESLSESYGRAISDGIKMARKQIAPNLLELPMPTAQQATP